MRKTNERLLFFFFCLWLTLGFSSPRLYSQTSSKGSFLDKLTSGSTTKKTIKTPTEMPATTASPNQPTGLPDLTVLSPPNAEISEVPPALFSVVFSPSLDPAVKEKADTWVKQLGFSVQTLSEALQNSSRDRKTLLVGSFDLSDVTFLNGQIMGLTPAIAEIVQVPFIPTVLNIKGPVYAKNDAKFQDMTINVDHDLILEDYAQLKNNTIVSGRGSVILRGRGHTIRVVGNNLSCSLYDPTNLSADSNWRVMLRVELGDTTILNNEIHHCSVGIWVDPGTSIIAEGNNIHHTILGVYFWRGCDRSGTCRGDTTPPGGEVDGNTISSSRIGVYVGAGRPDISPDNTFAVGDGMSIALVNNSRHTTRSPNNYLIALQNRWPFPIRDPRYTLSTTYDTFASPFVFSSIINDSRNPKNIIIDLRISNRI